MTARLTVLLVLATMVAARAGVSDTPLPTFADAQTASLVATFQASKAVGLDTDVVCTNLGPGVADVGVELFDAAGVLANTIATGNGAVLSVAVGRTVTIGSGATAALHEDALIALEPPVTSLRQGSGRIVATSPHLGCIALAVDRLHAIADPAVCPTCQPPAIALLPFDAPSGTTTTTSPSTSSTAPGGTSSTTSSSTTSTAGATTSSTTSTTGPGSSSSTTSTSTATSPSSTSTTSSTSTSTTTTTLPSCAATRGLAAVVCACDRDLPTSCPIALLPPRLAARTAHACALGARAAAATKPRIRQRLARRAIARVAALARAAASGRHPAPAACASTLADVAARAMLPIP